MDYSEYDGGYQFHELKLVSCFRGDEYGVSSVCFDPQEDLLWAATYEGHVTSFYSSSLEKYTAFQAHHADIRQMQPTMNGILSMTGKELRLTTRTGFPLFTLRDDTSLNEMNCLLYLDETNLLVGCQTNQITSVDLTTAQVTGQTPMNDGICLLKLSEQYLCSGDVTGQVYILDPHSFQIVGSFQAHTSGMCDMDVVDNYVITCGLTQQYGQLCVDCQLKIFDLRAMRPVSPCNVTMLQPFLIKSYPHLSSTILVLSQMGEFQFLDVRGLVTPSNMIVNQLSVNHESTMACTVDVGPSACIAFGDSSGIVHLWSNQEGEELALNPYAQPSVFPDEVEETPFISWDDDDPNTAPLSAVPMYLNPHTPNRGTFLSQWPTSCSKFTRRVAPSIDPEVLGNMRMSQFVGHAPKPAHLRRNQVPYDLERDWNDSVPESPMMREINPLSLVPKPYRQVEIKYSKLGIETFDFGHYNDTKFAGLEIHIPNAYCNSMLQVLYFLEPVRCAMRNHLCPKEFCLACELGFLFQMLDQSDGRSCQANNFLRAFRTLREASALGLLLNWEDDGKKANLAKLIQSWNRFVLEQLNQETQIQLPPSSGSLTGSFTSQTGLTAQDQLTAAAQTLELETKFERESYVPPSTSGPPHVPPSPLVLSHVPPPRSHVPPPLSDPPHVPSSLSSSSHVPLSLSDPPHVLPSPSDPPNVPPSPSDHPHIPPAEPVSLIQRLFGSEVETLIECRCGWRTTTKRTELLFSLFYQNNAEEVRGQKMSFVDVLKQSICRQQRLHAWCENCAKFRPTTQQKSLCSLPFVLSINCQIENDADREYWQQTPPPSSHPPTHVPSNSKWIPMSMRLRLKDTSEGKSLDITECLSANDCEEKESEKEGEEGSVSGDYELVMAVGHVKETWMEVPGNLVAHIKVGPSYHIRKEGVAKTQWYLFNDFHITPLKEDEVGVFPTEWFTPCILVFAKKGFAEHFNTKITSQLDRSVLLTETRGIRPVQSPATFTPLSLAESPQPGDLAAIDAEFVTLNQEEAEVKSDGTHTTLKPSQYGVARITVIRGKGPLEGTPFIDDYISTSEQVVDYLTKFSGIKPGDLDATMSSKHLTTLKASYLKLIYLLEKGVKFVGHGLKKDFRVINIMVPSEQVMDTVELFHLPNQRYISLKFLAWFYLRLHIQEGAHDSCEDARTALMLYRKYCELEVKGQTKQSLKKLYEAGRSCGWQVPDGH